MKRACAVLTWVLVTTSFSGLLSDLQAATIGGRVLSAGARPVEHARVTTPGGDRNAFTDRDGFFDLVGITLPVAITVEHPRFETRTVTVERTTATLEITLKPKQKVFEAIAVSANRGEENFAPVGVATSVVRPIDASAPATSVTELLAETAAVSENGQGGIFQTYSVRGISRQRVLTLVDGMRIVGERRAGVSASFVDPLLVESIDVVRGPSSTYYGSGALGGVVQLFPRRFDGTHVVAGAESQGGKSHALVASGSARTSWGIAYRRAGDAETPAGETLNSSFNQLATSFRTSWQRGDLTFDLSLLGSAGTDIGKANTDWPDRVTVYPEERHVIARLGIRKPASWELAIAMHPNRLDTKVTEVGKSFSELANEAFDLGVTWQRRLTVADRGTLRLGVDLFARRGVDARERRYDLSTGSPRLLLVQETLSGGAEDELGMFGAWEWNWGRSVVVAGGRLAWQRQENGGLGRTGEEAVTAFAGVVLPVGAGFEIVANAGTGLRFPSLSERFFAGTTGRGFVVGNRDLAPEESLNLDAGLRFYGERLYVSGYVFSNDIADYIERVEVAPERLTFRNLSSGTIEGFELDGFVQLDPSWSISFGGHLLEGREDNGDSLADIPADRLFLGTRVERGSWQWRVRWEARSSKSDPGSGEKAIPAVSLVSSSVEYQLRPGLGLRLAVRNALDEAYFSSADRKVPEAPGRSLALEMRWSPDKTRDITEALDR